MAKNIKRIPTGYRPRPLQKLLHSQVRRFNVLVCHRRFGKTFFAVPGEMIDRALRNQLHNPQYAYIAPTYRQAKKVAWQYLVDYTRNIPGVQANKSELTVYIPRPGHLDPVAGEPDPDEIKIMLLGSDDPDDIRGIYLDGAVIDEYAKCDPLLWGQIVRAALADRKGWAIFIGTPKGQNHFFRRYNKAKAAQQYAEDYIRKYSPALQLVKMKELETRYGITEKTVRIDLNEILKKMNSEELTEYNEWRKYLSSRSWFTAMYKASETGIIDQEEMDDMIEDMSEEEVEQELECSFTAAIIGSYYGHLVNNANKEGRVKDLPYDPRYPVDTFWDIGIGDKTAIWFRQKVNRSWHYIDYLEDHGKGLPFYVKKLRERPYTYGKHVWPHDGSKKEWSTGIGLRETARTHNLRVEIQTKHSIQDKIEASRNRIQISYFDKVKCEKGLDCLYNFQKEFDSKRMIFKETPLHDWSSDGADAFGYSSLDDRAGMFDGDRFKQLPKKAHMNYNPYAR